MANNWQEVMLMDACGIIKRGITPKYAEKGILVLNQRCIRDQRVSTEVARRHDCDARKVPVDRVVQEGDVLINSTGVGTLGRVAQVKDINENTTVDSHVTLVRLADRENIHIDFFGWAMKYKQPIFEAMGEGSTGQTELSRHRVGEVIINYPPLPEQKAIAYILGKLDDKIELNRQMNETLEAMAQALFKSWFVDFDPVIDNALLAGKAIPEPLKQRAEMRQAQLDSGKAKTNSEINDLFPSEFEFTEELGWIPKGWEVKQIKDLGKVVTGKTPPKRIEDAYSEVGTPFITPTDIDNQIFSIKTGRYLSDNGVSAVKNSVLKPGAICVTCIGSQMGKTIIAPYKSISNQQINSITDIDLPSRNFLFFNLKRRRDELFQLGSSGSTMPILNKGNFEKLKVIYPTRELLKNIDTYFQSILDSILENEKQSETLAKLRDTLLPKLMSGELRIPDAEKLVADI